MRGKTKKLIRQERSLQAKIEKTPARHSRILSELRNQVGEIAMELMRRAMGHRDPEAMRHMGIRPRVRSRTSDLRGRHNVSRELEVSKQIRNYNFLKWRYSVAA